MPDETKRVRATLGEFAGREIDMPAADADQAISDGWAVDPFAPPPETPEEPMSAEDQEKAVEASSKAIEKLRAGGEPEKEAKGKKAATPEPETGGYKTRSRKGE